MRVLVTGGVRSGKSRHAERLLAGHPNVLYVAAGPTPAEDPDPDWAARVAAHRARRPASWRTLETRDLPAALVDPSEPALVDCLGTWLAGVLDERALWDEPAAKVTNVVRGLAADVVGTLAGFVDLVLVTNEVGLGIVPEHRSARLFRDLLGLVNQEMAAVCDEVHLVIAGRVLVL